VCRGSNVFDVVVTDTRLAGALHERVHQMLPGIEEVRFDETGASRPVVIVADATADLVHRIRDREEEIAGFARRVKAAVRAGEVTSLSRVALVVKQPLPYVYLAREC
jgi:hypothetical protein